MLAENLLLRQQLLVLRRQAKRAKLTIIDRVVILAASTIAGTWRESVLLVKPETILRWHRQGFQMFWYVRDFNDARPHQGLDQNLPSGVRESAHPGNLVSLPVLGGLHHDYRRVA